MRHLYGLASAIIFGASMVCAIAHMWQESYFMIGAAIVVTLWGMER